MTDKILRSFILLLSLFPISVTLECLTSSSVKLSPKSCQQYRTDSIDDLIPNNYSSSPWCMLIKLEDFSFIGHTECSNGVGTSETFEQWDLCQKLMRNKLDNESCFEMNNAKYRSERSGRNYKMNKITIFCCRNEDDCNSKDTFVKSDFVCSQLRPNWPPLPKYIGDSDNNCSNIFLQSNSMIYAAIFFTIHSFRHFGFPLM